MRAVSGSHPVGVDKKTNHIPRGGALRQPQVFGTQPLCAWRLGCGSIPHIFFIPFDFVFAEQRQQLVLKIHLPVVFLLSGDVWLHLFQIRLADREIRVAALPFKVRIIPALRLQPSVRGQQNRTLRRYLNPELLIIDDFDLKQLPKNSGEHLFEVIMRR